MAGKRGFCWVMRYGVCTALLMALACPAQEPRTADVVRHGWHTGLVLRAADLPGDSLLRRDFPQATYVEVGWGDRAFYMAPHPGPWLALRAIAWPRPGVLHVVGLRESPRQAFPGSEIAQLPLASGEFEQLHQRLQSSFERDARGAPIPLGPGLYGDSRFYASTESFHLFKTCNTWTAQVLRSAGVRVSPALTAGGLMRSLAAQREAAAAGPSK